jgi:hypothetical protein
LKSSKEKPILGIKEQYEHKWEQYLKEKEAYKELKKGEHNIFQTFVKRGMDLKD